MGEESDVASHDDGLLADAVRAGDPDAFRILFQRYRAFAERIARSHAPASEEADVVAEAFLAVYAQLRSGGGPRDDFRAYLRRTVVNEAIDRHRHAGRTRADEHIGERLAPAPDHAGPWFETTTIARAYRSLPARWRRVLWQVEVESRPVREVARAEGISAARVSTVAYRARRGLRAAYLSACLQSPETTAADCLPIRRLLPDDVRGASSRRQRERVERHLGHCDDCREVRAELVLLDQQLDAWLLPAAAGVGAGGLGLALTGGVTAGVFGFVTLPLLGVVTAGVIAGGVVWGGPGGPPEANAEPRPSMSDEQLLTPVAVPEAGPGPSDRAGDSGPAARGAGTSTPPGEDDRPGAEGPTPPPAPDETGDWMDRAPQIGDRISGGTSDTYRVRGVERETETSRGDDRELPAGPGEPAPGTTVWEREYDEVTVERYIVDLAIDDEDRWEVMCDGSLRERTMRAEVKVTITTRHRSGYRVEADGSRIPVQESEEVGRSFAIGTVLGNPPVECPPEPPPADTGDGAVEASSTEDVDST